MWGHNLVVVIRGLLFWFATVVDVSWMDFKFPTFWLEVHWHKLNNIWIRPYSYGNNQCLLQYLLAFSHHKYGKKQNTQNTQQNMLWNIVLTLTHNIAGLVDQKSIMDNSRLGEINTSIMFVTVRNPTVWAYIQLLRHINFHYKNKWLYNKHLYVSVVMIFECYAPVNGSVALQVVVVQSYLVKLCLSTLVCCWIRVFIVQFIIFSSPAMKNISLSLNM